MRSERVEHFRPLRTTARIRHITGDKDGVERIVLVNGIHHVEQPVKALISGRTGTATFDTKAVAFAYNMDIRYMGDAPRSDCPRSRRELTQVARRVHRCVGPGPDDRGASKISRHEHRAVGQSNGNQLSG